MVDKTVEHKVKIDGWEVRIKKTFHEPLKIVVPKLENEFNDLKEQEFITTKDMFNTRALKVGDNRLQRCPTCKKLIKKIKVNTFDLGYFCKECKRVMILKGEGYEIVWISILDVDLD